MTYDNNTIVTFILALTTAVFAFGYIKQRIMARMAHYDANMKELREGFWRDIDEANDRIDALEQKMACCKQQQSSCNKQGSNTY